MRGLSIQQFILPTAAKQFFPFCRINRSIDAQITRQHSIYISIDHRIRHVIRKRTNGSGCILPYPFEGTHLRISFRKYPIHALGGGMQITGTRIIAQSLPILHHFVFIRLGQSGDIGKTFHKADEIIVPLHHTRLLKNDFRYPYYIRICESLQGSSRLYSLYQFSIALLKFRFMLFGRILLFVNFILAQK